MYCRKLLHSYLRENQMYIPTIDIILYSHMVNYVNNFKYTFQNGEKCLH